MYFKRCLEGNKLKALFVLPLLGMLSACASPYAHLPVHTGTIVATEPSTRQEWKPSPGGAVVGAAVGAGLGYQVGKGHGRRVATVVGGVLGGVAGAAAAGSEKTINTTGVEIEDDATHEKYKFILDGDWRVGQKFKFSIDRDTNTFVFR